MLTLITWKREEGRKIISTSVMLYIFLTQRSCDKMLCIYHLGQNFEEHAGLFGFLIYNPSEESE